MTTEFKERRDPSGYNKRKSHMLVDLDTLYILV